MSKIWVGSFFDRFGTYKLGVLSNSDATIQAAIKDCMVRRFIDLTERREELISLVTYIAGVTGYPLVPETVVDTPATADELWGEASETTEVETAETLPTGTATVYQTDSGFVTVGEGESAPDAFIASWPISALRAALIAEGASLTVRDGVLVIEGVVS